MNPFRFQGPPATLIDRRDELDVLQRAAANAVAVRLAAPRRFGKTTLLEAHLDAMRQVGHRAIRVDFSKVATVADVAARVALGYRDLPPDPEHLVRRWASRLGVSLKLGPVGVAVNPRPQQLDADQARFALLELLDLPLRLHEADAGLTVIAFDEFQDLLIADTNLDGLMRSVIQHHGRAAGYVFAGSEPSLMRALFSEYERPFYGQASPLELGPLPLDEAVMDIEDALREAGLLAEAGGAVSEIVGFTGGHPQRTILIAHHLFEVLDEDGRHDDPAGAAIERALAATRDAHQALWDTMDRNARLVSLALADGEPPTSRRLSEEHRVPRSTLSDALDRLASDGRNVERPESGRPFLLDPLFAEWLRRR
ncbi:MAG: hypothetical protein WKF94_07765 [Solirubrobacteraceae bacterium]